MRLEGVRIKCSVLDAIEVVTFGMNNEGVEILSRLRIATVGITVSRTVIRLRSDMVQSDMPLRGRIEYCMD